MKKNNVLYIIVVMFFIVFLILGQSCASLFGGGSNTVYYYPNGGSGTAPSSQRVKADSSIILPDGTGLSNGDAIFGGWILYSNDLKTSTLLAAGSSFIPTQYTSLFAKWNLDVADLNSAKGLNNKLVWLQNNVESGGNYVVDVNANESIGPKSLFFPGKEKITITLRGIGTNRTINILSTAMDSVFSASMFTVPFNVTFIIDTNITLQGNISNNEALVSVVGKMIMNNGSVITGNGGCGVVIEKNGNFEMNGGTISNNNYGGVNLSGNFTMNGGTISGNNKISEETNLINLAGAGVFIWGTLGGPGNFIMNGGNITGNKSSFRSGSGGVYTMTGGKFTKKGGTISGNIPE